MNNNNNNQQERDTLGRQEETAPPVAGETQQQQPDEQFETLYQKTPPPPQKEVTGEALLHNKQSTQDVTPTTIGETGAPAQKKQRRLERLEQRKAQIENQIKAIHARENEKVRRERTRRLVQIGAIALKYLDCPPDIEPKEFEAFVKQIVEQPEVKRSIQR